MTEEFDNFCNLINADLKINFYDQKWMGKRVWGCLSDGDIVALEKLAEKYNSKLKDN